MTVSDLFLVNDECRMVTIIDKAIEDKKHNIVAYKWFKNIPTEYMECRVEYVEYEPKFYGSDEIDVELIIYINSNNN